MPAVMKLEDYAAKINASWRKTTDSVLETAQLCAEVDGRLEGESRKSFLQRLDFAPATFSKLVTIGRQARLRDKPIRPLLPSSYSIVYELARLNATQLDAAVKDGVISPSMSRADLASWVAEREGRKPDAESDTAPRVLATLRVPLDYDAEKQMLLQKALEDLRAKFGFDLDQPKDPQTEEAMKVLHRIDTHIRKHARKFIGELRSGKLAGASKLSAAEQRKLWPHSEQDVEIADDATWDGVEAVLAKVGAGDQFERLRDEALRLNGVGEDFVREHRNLDHEQAMQEVRRTVSKFNGRFAGKGHASSAAAHR
jgi:hypothetical protein